ncbi:fimbrial protein [Pseudomonas sp. NA-150]|uniref:fimbrial protein n=1 Tax=Pseudomonas sp. NA-150 TaxID=3367525 RepID=UPI0037C65B83
MKDLRWIRPLLLLLVLSPASAFALVCKEQNSGSAVIHADLSSAVAIPASVPEGTVVWRSDRLNIQVECFKDGLQEQQEEVFLYLNPDSLLIGQGIRAGLTLDGVDYVQNSGRISTRQRLPVCHEGDSNIDACPRISFNLAFSVFIEKFGPTPPSGVGSHLLNYRMFQLDSGAGINPLPGHNLNYVINNLNGLRFIACDAELQIVPETVEFGSIGIQGVKVGQVVERRPFSLLTSRTCDTPFSLGARFRPMSGVLSGDVLVPAANNGVGIRIANAVSGNTIPYNQPFHLADLLAQSPASRADFEAQLLWNSAKPTAGAFEAEVIVDLFYK